MPWREHSTTSPHHALSPGGGGVEGARPLLTARLERGISQVILEVCLLLLVEALLQLHRLRSHAHEDGGEREVAQRVSLHPVVVVGVEEEDGLPIKM